ncbi:fatty acyl-CoA reductase 2, partial [Trichonephila inaurata madagascariensis]
ISKGFVKVVLANPETNLEIIPVDIVVNTHIVAAYSVSTGRYSSPFVVNCTSYGLPLQYSTLTPLYLRIFMKYPVPNVFRYSKHVWIVDNHIEKVFLSIFEHYIPAAVMDLMLILKGKKPKVFSLYRFLDRITGVTSYFTTKKVEFATENLRDLKNAVSPEKTEELYTDLNGFDLEAYAKDLVTGAPQYDWKNDKKSKTERVKLMKR